MGCCEGFVFPPEAVGVKMTPSGIPFIIDGDGGDKAFLTFERLKELKDKGTIDWEHGPFTAGTCPDGVAVAALGEGLLIS